MPEILKPDLCVIGAGSGGLTVAAAARALGASVVLIERAKMGGDCLNTGCVPSKALIAAAKAAQAVRDAAAYGVATEEPRVNFGRVHEHVRQVIGAIAPNDSVERFEAMGVSVIKAHARFVDKRTVKAGETVIRARRFVVATGSRAAIPPIPGIDTVPYLTNETVFELTRKPSHLIIIGGGPIGMELAQAHRRLGSAVTIIEMLAPLAKDDPELTGIALRRIAAEGVEVRAHTAIAAIGPRGAGGVAVTVRTDDGNEQTITGSHLLVAAGRVANVADMGLDAARIAHDKRGIKTTPRLKTTNAKVYAIGDVAGGLQFTHFAGYQAGLVVRNALFGLPVRTNPMIVPWVTFTDPEISQVGLTEHQARERLGGRFKVMRWSFAENDRARAERHTDGLIKLVTDRRGRILGAGIAGHQAGELIALFAFAIANKLKASHLSAFIAPYPTLSEIGRRVGIEFYKDKLSNPWLKRLMALNRLLP